MDFIQFMFIARFAVFVLVVILGSFQIILLWRLGRTQVKSHPSLTLLLLLFQFP